MASGKLKFETSQPLKAMLTPYFEEWRKRHGGDLVDLSQRCGVSPAYLGQVRRYGRIPGRPVLILLAFAFRIDGQRLFDAAGIRETFPYESGLEITRPATDQDGLFSFRFNMDRFSDSIRGIVRSELRQRSVKDLLGSRPLRIGANYLMFWMFGSRQPPTTGKHSGLWPELAEMLGLALQKEVELVSVPFSGYIDTLASGQLDLFGPTMLVPNLPAHIQFTSPVFRLGVSALFRKKPNPDLSDLPVPSLDALKDERYQIAIVRNSLMHFIANTRLKRPDSTLIMCASDEEAVERLIMRGISRPAHVYLCNSMRALNEERDHPKELKALFAERKSLIDMAEVGIAVRPDWPEMIPVINDALRFLFARGGLTERFEKVYSGEARQVVDLVQ